METKIKNSPTTSNKINRPRQAVPSYPASEKVQAVLAVWTDRCKAAEVCRQLKINFMTFQHWQRRAMEGMLQALESRVNLSQGQVLSPRLQALLASRQRQLNTAKMARRLEQIQLARTEEPAAKPQ
jgi:transposase-like protein